ncbi:TPA: P-type conjugative transfer protein TrbJ [Enterobacter hormaechei subsp. steigerwaltii]|jgi:P-type conjugative transfer protein TrbJ|uniref:P-type conjugative transfer protein TrbJ n=1 Tax=Enterobacteriaceae TaxID=543 RepID=UPI00053042A2|nr:P-type conjugative transfer protein TrbJ [Escherichia coli]EAT5352647.1 P-type conjugative transfer protein TrbJ [Salmonella enterica]EDK5405656.1 conjugal transfer protein TrbJ [Salmonella enterica subsp. enterica serovar Newport]EAX5070731.1 P-type conjugative transfer protein TrbJ [Salmonella enterica]EBP8466959.1 P-type conjugative transfer protein TrbJ [Salmonella enterica]EFE6523772.1 P-type conjugative transfer protein TrbJ [Escherichia coli]
MTNRIILAAKKALLASFVATVMTLPAQAGIPVIDGTNVVQTTISAVNNVQAVAKQIQQYQTQLQQYENMLQNTVAPAAYIWDQANSTINKLLQAQDTLNYYKNQAGSLDSYLQRYQDVNYYRSSPCFNSNVTCTADEIKALQNADKNNSEARKKANDAVFKAIDQQQQTLTTDANNLADLQSQASGAKGQMEAIQAANQLASAQTNQLLQIRSILLAQQSAAATLAQAEADKDAQRTAASAAIREGTYTKSPAKSW